MLKIPNFLKTTKWFRDVDDMASLFKMADTNGDGKISVRFHERLSKNRLFIKSHLMSGRSS